VARDVHAHGSMLRLHASTLALMAGCHIPDYAPPAWDPPPRAVATVGCVEFVPRLNVDGLGKVPGVPFAISFHSTCKENVALDLAHIRVRARARDGTWIDLAPYDPRREIRRAQLAPDDSGTEPIEFDPPSGSLTGWTLACVDFSAVLAAATPRTVPPICLDPSAKLDEVTSPDGWQP
jgi:hypothetical protein